MKKYMMIILAAVVGASAAVAGQNMFDGMTKEQLANYEITITDKTTGKVVGKMSRAEYKVVRIDSGSESVSKVINPPIRIADKTVVQKYHNGYTTVIVQAGVGKSGLSNSTDGSNHEVSERDRMVMGATACRSVENRGLCASAFTNKTFMMGLKFDF